MKWLQENWTMLVLVVLVLFIGYGWRNNVQNNREHKAAIEVLETDISLRQDTINDLKKALDLEIEAAGILTSTIDSLEIATQNQIEIIELKDKELEAEKKKIRDLTPDENVQLLATNLSNETGDNVRLKMQIIKNDTVVQVDIKHVAPLNIVFAERYFSIEKINNMQVLLDIKKDEIDSQSLLILSHVKSMGLLEETIEQKDEIITDKDAVITEIKKRSRKDKVKYFFIGFGTGILTGLGIAVI